VSDCELRAALALLEAHLSAGFVVSELRAVVVG
jgi:hypothetical protein